MLPPRKSKSPNVYFFTVDDSVCGSSLVPTTKKEKTPRQTYTPVIGENPESLLLSGGGYLVNSNGGKIILSS